MLEIIIVACLIFIMVMTAVSIIDVTWPSLLKLYDEIKRRIQGKDDK